MRARHEPSNVKTTWQSFDEPLHITLMRTVGIAVIVGAVVASVSGGGVARWAAISALALWPSFGGHWLELWFLHWLRPRLSDARRVQLTARLLVWFVGGIGFAIAMWLTAAMARRLQRPPWSMWYLAGFAFIGIELLAHLGLQRRGRPSFFNGRG